MPEIWISTFFRSWEKEIQYRGEKMGANRNEFIENASKILLSKSEEYKCIIDKIEHYLHELLKDVKGITISGRSKDANNIAEKIYRKNYMMKYNNAEEFIEDLPDGIGVRIVCLLNQDEVKIYKHLIDRMPVEKEIGNKSFRYREGENFYICTENQPEKQKNNLDIYRMDCIWDENEKSVRVELQIKSLTNYFWGEIEHLLFYKNYDFTIGNDFYSGLMKNIHNELQNIDIKMASLENHMKKSEHNQILEIRQISASMISQKFSAPIQEIVGCKIDLRESFMLLTDMHFGISSNLKDNLEKFNRLIDKLDKAKTDTIDEEYSDLDKQNLYDKDISESKKDIAKIIHDNIHDGDVFWQFLFLMYKNLLSDKDKNYSELLSEMSGSIRKLYIDIQDAADALSLCPETDISCIIDNIFLKLARDRNKISFFSLELELAKTKEILRNELARVQKKVVNENEPIDTDLFKENTELLELIIYVSTTYRTGRSLEDSQLIELLDLAEKRNDYSLELSEVVKNNIKQRNNLNTDDLERIFLIGKEEE